MTIQKFQYEELLAEYSNTADAIALLKQHRSYLEMLPSMRRPMESLITMPLPIVRVRETVAASAGMGNIRVESLLLPCDIALLMCDPEWKIKTGVEILIFIHRPEEDFSDLLGRWRQSQVMLGKDYEWVMPPRYQHILTEGADRVYPLFVVFEETPQRVKRGLKGACLPFITRALEAVEAADAEDAEKILQSEDS